jgi:hypothetical protein
MPMTSDARRALSATIRSLRTRLLDDLHAETTGVYRLTVRARDAGLDESARTRRARLEAWVAEQLRAQKAARTTEKGERTAEDFRCEAEKQAAYTLLNRLVILRLMEAQGPDGRRQRSPAVVTGGWESGAYKAFRTLAAALVKGDPTEGYALLLQLVFEDLATELPGLYGPTGVADLVPIPPATLRHVVEALDDPGLDTCWTDDMTLGWVTDTIVHWGTDRPSRRRHRESMPRCCFSPARIGAERQVRRRQSTRQSVVRAKAAGGPPDRCPYRPTVSGRPIGGPYRLGPNLKNTRVPSPPPNPTSMRPNCCFFVPNRTPNP